ncbi:hypothetical protein OIU77_020362 [Salix suchowensis]|uniref:RNA-BINDING PROTEIN 38-LIKE ISOFORM X1 n=2 Tax=Salix TaxID=40685 RepID=A0A9Q0P3E9_9ROSI|nr:hypothetical protein OIU77_020362 [Salix suchowensis]KAJ6680858.1 RNA-BINDING PROTEIN 38-LIKE ISOFORM X1 [Salix koriyanagi]
MAYQAIPGPSSGSSSSSGFQYMNSPFGDTTYTKVFVGGLAWETQSETMRRYFEQFGDILEAVVISDKNTGRSKGYGFDVRDQLPRTLQVCKPPEGTYVGSFGYQQPVPYGYQQGLMYHPYGYAAYGPEYGYQQGVYNPYATGQQYLQMYGVPGAVNSGMYPYGQLSQNVPGGHGYTSIPGYAVPGHQIVQFGGPSVNAITTSSMPTIQAPYHTGIAPAVPAQPQFIVPAPSPQYMQGSGSDQNTG